MMVMAFCSLALLLAPCDGGGGTGGGPGVQASNTTISGSNVATV